MTNVSENTPYLSVVVTARNDDHGGSLLRRMQTFLNGWIGQSKRHSLRSEVILVEWNPPPDRPPLREVLSWPTDLGLCSVRFVEVPAAMHQRYLHAGALPLYQMIAKNVGIRRARAPFVLATNIDILFSDELVSYLAQGRLEKGRMYRIDRLDVSSDVPVNGTVDEQLRYCESHLIRCNTQNGTFAVTSDGLRALEKADIAAPGCEVSFGPGWFPAESNGAYRWLQDDAEVTVKVPAGSSEPLTFELEPGPSAGSRPLTIQAVAAAGRILAESSITQRSEFSVQLPSSGDPVASFRLRTLGGGLPVLHDPRILNLRVLRCGWGKFGHPVPLQVSAPLRGLFTELMQVLTAIAHDGPANIDLPAQSKLRRIARAYVNAGGFTGAVKSRIGGSPAPPPLAPATSVASSSGLEDAHPAFLHTNGCGDFTLMAREHWFDLRGYPEFDLFSMNLDSVLCHAAHHAGFREEVLQDPLRIYHIEHGTGSGWTPEGQAQLFDRLRAQGIPWLDYPQFVVLAETMQRFNSPLIFNRENWGFAGEELEETVLSEKSSVAVPSGN